VIVNPDRSDPGRSRSNDDAGASDARILIRVPNKGGSAGNPPDNSRAWHADIQGPRKLESRRF
jgi:hypothetical protein